MASGKTFEDLDLSREEIKRIETALKDEKFRKMFVEYAEEISNPENRKRYEEEIAMMENERGMNVEFVNPQPGHVLKTVDDSGKKAFINICTSDKIGTPSSTKQTDAQGKHGLHWQIPHSFSPPREDIDKSKGKCIVYDVVFHPDTYRMASNPRFKKMIEDTAMEGIEKQFSVKLDHNNVKRPSMKFKGQPVATVIRSRKDNGDGKKTEKNANDPLNNMPYPYGDKTSLEIAEEKRKQAENMASAKKTKEDKTKMNTEKKAEKKEEPGYTIPKYTITHRSALELQEFTNAPDSKPTTRPKDLVINIQLPLCKSASGVDLDIFEDRLTLVSEKPAYKLDLKLPYPVEDENGSAKFDKSKKSLVVTLPVISGEVPKMPSFIDDMKPDVPPLIEELPPLEEITNVTDAESELPPLEVADNVEQEIEAIHKSAQPSTSTVSYSLPQYDFNQDFETVTFILHVKNISEESVSKAYPEPGTCEIKFASVGSGGFPWHYALYVKFDEGLSVIPEHSSVDISEKNMTWTLLKARENRVMWNKFSAGLDRNTLEDKLFLTNDNLHLQLEQLKAEGEKMVNQEEVKPARKPRVTVAEMNHKKLTIKLGAPKLSLSEDEDDLSDGESPMSADIEVIHTRAPPNLHGILKQRSMSESSEDRSSVSSESPSSTSPRDPDTPKHVTFSSHIDQTTFKTNMAVTSMKQALKSKRRRNRKKEEKKAERASRRRHNSNGSECSSSDEHDLRQSSESHSEDDHEKEELADQIEATGKKVEDCGVIDEEERADTEEQDECSPDEVAKTGESESKISGGKIRSKGKNKQKGSKKVNIAEQVKSKLAMEKSEAVDSDDDNVDEVRNKGTAEKQEEKNDENAQKVVDRTSVQKIKAGDGAGSGLQGTEGDGNIQETVAANNQEYTEAARAETESAMNGLANHGPPTELKSGQLVEEIKEEDGMHEKGSGDTEGEKEKEEKKEQVDLVETELSWKDVDRKSLGNEHKTECAFKFSNAVMYDLDID